MSTDLYFSRATLGAATGMGADIGAGAKARGATRRYLVHQAVCDLFGPFDERPYLYRSDSTGGAVETVLVLSNVEPGRGALSSRVRGLQLQSLETKPFPALPPHGARLDFELRVNATKDVPVKPGSRSKRVDVWEAVWRADRETAEDPHSVYGSYLQQRLEGLAKLESVRVTERRMVKARRSLETKAPIMFVETNLIGTLTVLDAGRMRERIASGIGRSRSLGCGLLCLSRPGTVLTRRYTSAVHVMRI